MLPRQMLCPESCNIKVGRISGIEGKRHCTGLLLGAALRRKEKPRVEVRKAGITAGCKQFKGGNKVKGEKFRSRRNSKTKANFVVNLFSPQVDILRQLQKYRGQSGHWKSGYRRS